jgi:hypothetical protein
LSSLPTALRGLLIRQRPSSSHQRRLGDRPCVHERQQRTAICFHIAPNAPQPFDLLLRALDVRADAPRVSQPFMADQWSIS